MDRKFLMRCIILMVLLLICTVLAWYLTTQVQVPSDAVLAGGKPWAMQHCI